ncbi:MAG TPA: OmpA family protein [Chthoniobacterales bacterium]|jgi:flagellar motor protein MotB|nr:OmpA family protein [Chthoniobacterales bacterium]
MSGIKQTSTGLELRIGGDGYRKLKASQQGLFYWDAASQDVLLDSLDEFLPRVTERQEAGATIALFRKVVEGREVCGTSTALAKDRLPRELIARLDTAIVRLRETGKRPGITPDAKLLIERFTLPDPARVPDFYRTYNSTKGKHLVILWGCEQNSLDSVAPDIAVGKLRKESFLVGWIKRAKWLMLLLLIGALAWLIFELIQAWPQARIQTSKSNVTPAEVTRLRFEGSRGRFFELNAPTAQTVQASETIISQISPEATTAHWLAQNGQEGGNARHIDIAYPNAGAYPIELTAHGSLLGVPLPQSRARITVFVEDLPAAPEIGAAPAPSGNQLSSGRLRVEVKSRSGEFPANISAHSTEGGELDFAGTRYPCEPGKPVAFSGFSKPGKYKIDFLPGLASANKQPDTVFLRLDPPSGASPVVANLRLSPSVPRTGEKILADTTASYNADPDSSIVQRELSLDGGQTFNKLTGGYEVIPPRPPGTSRAILRLTDDKGRVAQDTQDLTVTPGIALPSTPIENFAGGSTDRVITVSAPDNVLFGSGSAALTEGGQRVLAEFGRTVSSRPYVVQIVGHTDDRRIQQAFPNNQALSEARAAAAAKFLINNTGLPADRVKVLGLGDSAPLVPNTSEPNRAKNRRIDITLLPLESAK